MASCLDNLLRQFPLDPAHRLMVDPTFALEGMSKQVHDATSNLKLAPCLAVCLRSRLRHEIGLGQLPVELDDYSWDSPDVGTDNIVTRTRPVIASPRPL